MQSFFQIAPADRRQGARPTGPPLAAPGDVARILLVKLSSLGDVIHGTAAIAPLEAMYPGAEIAWAVDERFAAVPKHHPGVTRVFEASRLREDPLRELRALSSTTEPLRREGVNLAIDIQGTIRSAAWTYASGAPVKAGRGGWRPGWRCVVRPDLRRHAVQVIGDILESLGIPAAGARPSLHWPAEAEEKVETFLQEQGIAGGDFAVFNPFSRWTSKEWPLDRFAALARELFRETGAPVVVTGSPAEVLRADAFCNSGSPARVLSAAGALDLAGMFCLLRRARVVVTVDSGPMHAAAAVGTPVVALFGPTLPERTGPWGEGHVVLQAARPDSHHAYRRREGGRFIEALGIDAVWPALRERWNFSARPRP